MNAQLGISLGDVFFLRCTLCAPPKDKFFVVVQTSPLRMVLINSERTEFAQASTAHVKAQPQIFASEHIFLTHDSFVACDQISHEYSIEKLQAQLLRYPSIRRGKLHENAMRVVGPALCDNHLLPQKYVKDLKGIWVWTPTS
ncbi:MULTISPECIES: hypothetical protein [Xanthomonas]|uniref:hypothetical protein n=1 Tax=Xanthomonas TaxID=338 RepID=UPI001ADAF3E9|nr:hypothetical protein [Xanthomonas phaseoli]MBO9766535.1 hypothetical protein [Xanthomonas phaseoli pv. dieffenbachiae]MBO9776119.1 hypothetical protein [Xanthomonas phaseoli pv. dieffenbachiae]MBO9778282.1 hypothetical protein [Xanthomonas phaseoli pv. dieffenbachiae]MBO9795330.1 hypothetical protein [Xanthomonas phaseoli pv. dieffenbachiae]MBO9801475.1 hypothetical protein [Xanthomonas phaseoli pv. dieffenbachiae]